MFGNSFGHDDERQQGCARFLCSLYGNKANSSVQTVLQQWYTNLQFAANQRCSQVPCRRANYQACIWQNSLEAAAHTPSPHGYGWDVIDGHISIHWMDQQPAPKALLQFISCNCLKGHCVGGRCSCWKNVMSCTDACGCVECSNTQDIGRTENDSSGEDEDWTNNLVDPYAMPHFMISIWNSHFMISICNSHFIELVRGKNDHCYFLLIHFQCTSYTDSYSATANTYCKRGMQQTLLFQTSRTYR